jgi:hypothetical protein
VKPNQTEYVAIIFLMLPLLVDIAYTLRFTGDNNLYS